MSLKRFLDSDLGDVSASSIQTGSLRLRSKGSATQTGSATTAVTLNARAGFIQTYALSNATNGTVTFTVNNSKVSSTSLILCNIVGYTGNGQPISQVNSVTDGSFAIKIRNVSDADPLNASAKIAFVAL